MMTLERKICLPPYKLAYSFCFVLVLSLVRGVSFTCEIGVAMEAPMAVLAIVFCADTYTQEIVSKRSEVHRLYPVKNRLRSMAARMAVQQGALILLSAIGYGLFFLFQNPPSLYQPGESPETEWEMFLMFLAAMIVTLCFWGSLSNLLSCLFRNMWAGIECCIAVWLVTNSLFGDQVLGDWNVFSYTFRNIADSRDVHWLYGKVLCLVLCAAMAFLMPKIIRKRG